MPAPVQIAFKPVEKPAVGENNYRKFSPGKQETLPAGFKVHDDSRQLDCAITIEHDVEIVVRDGARLYVDIYRPAGAQTGVPAVLGWSCYGKKYTARAMLPMTVWQCCVPKSVLSGLEKFEGLDPAIWCARGYAIISVDSRGTGNSDGQIPLMGSQDAEDMYDVIEALARMPWCNGNIGMAGNSALAISQWFAAALRPPSLKAIAPWEGSGDLFREQFVRGGVFSMSNFDLITNKIIRGPSGIEDFAEMYRRSPVSNPFWEDKRADMTKIQCPVFITGSDITQIHTMGGIRGWLEVPHNKKWIKWSGTQEWYELYCDGRMSKELQQFFDRYLKEEKNGWESTPKIRWCVYPFGNKPDVHDIVLPDYPVPDTQYRTLYLNGGKLHKDVPERNSQAQYDSELFASTSNFTFEFSEPTRLLGLPKAVLYMSCLQKDDLNVFVILRKRDKNGKLMMHLNFPIEATPVKSIEEIPEKDQQSTCLHLGSIGVLRASHRDIDSSRSIHPNSPFHPHTRERKVPPGDIVKLEIGIWNVSMDFDAGESLSMQIGGKMPSIAEYSAFSVPRPEHELNKGVHQIHCGPSYQSRLILPVIPTQAASSHATGTNGANGYHLTR